MTTPSALNSLQRERGERMALYYPAVLNILGPSGVILPIGDYREGQPNATTFTTVGDEQVTFTWSKAPNTFDDPLDLNLEASWQGIIPIVHFDGTDEQADTPDAAAWSRGDGTNDFPFSVGMWVKFDTVAGNQWLLTKDNTTDREWAFASISSKLRLELFDDSAGVQHTREIDVALTTGFWQYFLATYDGVGGATAANNIIIYIDGAVRASTASNDSSYVAMENLTAKVELLGRNEASFLNGFVAGGPLGPFFVQKVLTADESKQLYNLGRRALGV